MNGRNNVHFSHDFLLTIAAPSRPRNVSKGVNLASQFPVICMAESMLLKEHRLHMCALQHLTRLILFHGDCSKQEFDVCLFI